MEGNYIAQDCSESYLKSFLYLSFPWALFLAGVRSLARFHLPPPKKKQNVFFFLILERDRERERGQRRRDRES